ncbi:MAG: hypothetical protein CYPHOPRED_004757 [Cyphobasidiales sp. Tagirdzhanova-0007]|nr:MAG: hypothetical protein CYPHOPRED_004757 [Cyphobasidiales sp. Tagirdzhanova-0007]
MTLWDAINYLRTNISYGSVSVAWDDESPNGSYILLALSASSIRLLFSGITQRLLLIEVLPPVLATLNYKGQSLLPFSDASAHLPSTLNAQRMLNKRFGPTYPPSQHPSYSNEQILSYPGVIFGFRMDPSLTKSSADPSVSKKDPIDKDGGEESVANTSRPLRRLLVTLHNPSNEHAEPFPDIAELDTGFPLPAVADGDISHLGDASIPTIIFVNTISLDNSAEPVKIELGTSSAEDLICELGPPVRTYWKEDHRLSIHSASSPSPSPTASMSSCSNAYFFSYFSLGLDFLLHPTTHKVIKVIIHSNTPGESSFGRYAKCRWEIAQKRREGGVTGEDDIERIKSFLSSVGAETTPISSTTKRSGSSLQRAERAMLLDRVADSGDGLKLDRQTGDPPS